MAAGASAGPRPGPWPGREPRSSWSTSTRPAPSRWRRASRRRGAAPDAVRADLSEESDVVAAVGATVDRYGRLDVLHNNAALTDSDFLARDTQVTELSLEVWERTMAVNLRSQMLTCKHAIPEMVRGRGRLHHQHVVGGVAQRRPHPHGLRGVQGRRQHPDHVRGHRARQAGGAGQHHRPRPHHHRRRPGPPHRGDAGRAGPGHPHAVSWANPRTSPTSWSSWLRTSPATSPDR